MQQVKISSFLSTPLHTKKSSKLKKKKIFLSDVNFAVQLLRQSYSSVCNLNHQSVPVQPLTSFTVNMLKESKDPVARTLTASQATKPQLICSPNSPPCWNLTGVTLTPGLHQVTKMLFELAQSRNVHVQIDTSRNGTLLAENGNCGNQGDFLNFQKCWDKNWSESRNRL